jgi:hypothetical protein
MKLNRIIKSTSVETNLVPISFLCSSAAIRSAPALI